jgi:hypothetical protein
MIRFSSFLRVTLALSASLSAPALDRKISEKTARRLVQEALVALGQPVPPSQVRYRTFYWAPEFYTFEAVLGQTGSRPALTWFFAVNPWNGEVWNSMECSRITSRVIEREQEDIWKRSRLPPEAREPLHYKYPGDCDPTNPRTATITQPKDE